MIVKCLSQALENLIAVSFERMIYQSQLQSLQSSRCVANFYHISNKLLKIRKYFGEKLQRRLLASQKTQAF